MFKVLPLITMLAVAAPAFAQAPGAPSNLSNSVNGTTVVLTWSAASGSVSGYLVEAAFSPGGAVIASLPVAGTSLTVPNVPPGTYFVRVRALNGGAQSGPSNETTVTVGGSTGCPGPPTAPIVAVNSTALTAGASWSTGTGCPSTSFVLQAGSGPGLSNVAQINMGGQTAVSAMVPPGEYYVRVIGSNQFGTSPPSEDLLIRVAVNTLTETVRANGVVTFDVTLTQSGVYTGTLVWLDPTIDLDLYLTTPGCTYPPTSCLLAISDLVGVNTESVAQPVVAGQSFRLFIDNFTSRTTSFSIINTVAPADQTEEAAAINAAAEGAARGITKMKQQ